MICKGGVALRSGDGESLEGVDGARRGVEGARTGVKGVKGARGRSGEAGALGLLLIISQHSSSVRILMTSLPWWCVWSGCWGERGGGGGSLLSSSSKPRIERFAKKDLGKNNCKFCYAYPDSIQ